MSHVELPPGDHHRRPVESARRFPHRGERLGQQGVELRRQGLLVVRLEFVEAGLQAIALVRILAPVLGRPDLFEFGRRGAQPFRQACAEDGGLPANLIVRQPGKPFLLLLDGLDDWPDLLHFPVVLRAEDHLHQFLDHPCPFLYSPWAAIYSATASGTR